jgi:hypothetical protein
MFARRIVYAGAVLFLTCIVGCGDSGPHTIKIRGLVHYNGQPLQDGLVVYVPKRLDDARQATGRIQRDGTFTLTTFKKGDGVVPGEYTIVLQEAYAPGGEQAMSRAEHEAAARSGRLKAATTIPEKYLDPKSSDLSDTVDSDHSGFKQLDLTG